MAANPLKRSINEAVRVNHELARLFASAGTTDHPRGAVLSSYRTTLRALKADTSTGAIRDTMQSLQREIHSFAREKLLEASSIGTGSAIKQMGYYGKKLSTFVPPPQIEPALDAINSVIQAQTSAALGLASTRNTTQITGDQNRQGVVQATAVTSALAFWMATMLAQAMSTTVLASGSDFKKQSIAALDGRTTDCCLRAHAQIQPMNGLFILSGTPRFADKLDWTPFHWYCRTSIALYLDGYDLGLTEQMRDGANFLLSERKAGRHPDRDPADAFWQ